MKKIFLLTALFFQLMVVFGQTSTNWGPWTSVSCYKGIQYSVANLGYNKSTNSYWWNVRWKNNYSKAVSFDGEVIIGGENSLHGGFGNIQPNGIYTYTSLPYKSSSTNFTVSVTKVCFAERYGGCSITLEGFPNYAVCDNGTPNYKINAKKINGNTTSTNGVTTTSPSNTQQKDPNFDRNNASYQDYYKRATAAGQAGNYDEAISLWNSAISVSVNDTQRDNAKAWLAEAQKAKTNNNYQQQQARQQALLKQQQEQQRQQYNSTVNQGSSNLQTGNYTGAMQNYADAAKTATTKTEKKLAVTGVVASGFGGVLDAIAKAKEEKRERERIEQQQREQKRIEQERIAQQATNLMEQNWQNAMSLAKQGEYNQAINLMLPYLNADKINAYSTGLIGFWYYNVNDYKSAKICYEKALKIDKKSCAMHYLGTLYEQGLGVEKNDETALSYYKQSCENEDGTGCENYEKLKPIVEEARKVAEERKSNAKITISNFDFKPHVDYLILQLEAHGLIFNNVKYFCAQEFSKKLTIEFLKNDKKLVTTLQIEYKDGLLQKISYNVDENLRNDLSTLQLTALIGDEKINTSLYNGSFTMVNEPPASISPDAFKNSKYKGFQQETAIHNEETMGAYLHNYGISCADNQEKIKWLQKIVDSGGDIAYHLTLEDLYKVTGDATNALKTFSNYVSKIANINELNDLSEKLKVSLKNNLDNYTLNKLIVLAETGNANASYQVAEIFRRGEISGESRRTSSNSVTVPILRVQKNWEKAVKYYTTAYEGNVQKGYAACSISNLYDEGGNTLEKNSKLRTEWKRKAKEADYKCK